MILRNIELVTKADIENLIASQVVESKQLEYKRELPERGDGAKKEFLFDVLSFANASGGDIIFGLQAESADGSSVGYPTAVHPIPSEAVDEVKLWMEEVIRSGIEPRLSVQIREISGFGEDCGDCVILMRVPKSFASPHVVKLKGTFKFYSRHSAGKYPLDVDELRNHFLATESQAERIRQFRQERIGRLLAGETATPLSSERLAVLHVVPLSTFLNNTRQPISSVGHSRFAPFGSAGQSRFNLDGRLSVFNSGPSTEASESYCQLFFNGAVETVDAELVSRKTDRDRDDYIGSLNSGIVEHKILEAISEYAAGFAELGISGPAIVAFTLVNCKGVNWLTGSNRVVNPKPVNLDRDVAIFPDLIIEYIEDYERSDVRSLLDSIWNAFGFPFSYNFTDDGTWKPSF